MTIVYIYLAILFSLSIYSVYLHLKSHSNLTEYGKAHQVKLFWLGTYAGKKYLNEKGLRYKKRANIILVIQILLTVIFFLLLFL
jgi:hypothetical protein